MQYIYFQDWSHYVWRLQARGIPHGGAIIKAFPSSTDPRTLSYAGSDKAHVVQVSDEPLAESDVFVYGTRVTLSGKQIEQKFLDRKLDDEAIKKVRALWRLNHLPSTRFTEVSMNLKNNQGEWVIHDPLEDIDGLRHITRDPDQVRHLHCDIFAPEALSRFRNFLGIHSLAEDQGIIKFDAVKAYLKEGKAEWYRSLSGKER